LTTLSGAEESEVLAVWQGLGYYSRARKLHACARILQQQYGGHFPRQYKDLLKLPGIGSYTAAAIASLAFGQPVPALDGNVSRVTARLAGLSVPIHTPLFRRQALSWLQNHIPLDDPGRFNEALMETGAILCIPRQPLCHRCALSAMCSAYRLGLQDHLPVKASSIRKKNLYLYCLLLEKDGALALAKRPPDGLWGGMYDVPCVDSEKPIKRGLLKHFEEKYQDSFAPLVAIAEYRFVLTHRVVHCTFLRSRTKNPTSYHWLRPEDYRHQSQPLARAARHALRFLAQA
jgi:A/G-specific adenine glycosylase